MRGYIKVNDRLETTAPGVWAVGDCASSPQFTHVSFDCECGCIRIIRELRPDLHVHRAHHRRPQEIVERLTDKAKQQLLGDSRKGPAVLARWWT